MPREGDFWCKRGFCTKKGSPDLLFLGVLFLLGQLPAPSDTWLNIMTGLGAGAAVAGVLGGAYLAGRYGRRASVSVQAEAHENPGGVLIVARPSVKSVGIFRVRFQKERGAVVTATEMWVDGDGEVRADGRARCQPDVFRKGSLVEGAEELMTTVTIQMPKPTDPVIGWAVELEIRARHRFLYYLLKVIPKVGDKGYFWTDQVVVPRPPPPQKVIH